MLVWECFSYTKQEKVVDMGPLEITAAKKETVNWPTFAGDVILVADIVVLVTV
jgi:hypothetical protein